MEKPSTTIQKKRIRQRPSTRTRFFNWSPEIIEIGEIRAETGVWLWFFFPETTSLTKEMQERELQAMQRYLCEKKLCPELCPRALNESAENQQATIYVRVNPLHRLSIGRQGCRHHLQWKTIAENPFVYGQRHVS